MKLLKTNKYIIFLIAIIISIFTISCLALIVSKTISSTTSPPETTTTVPIDPIQKKLNKIENQYSLMLRQKIESLPDEKCKTAILNNDKAIKAINFFDGCGYADLLLDKKIALEEFGFVKLYEILKPHISSSETIDDYIKNVTDPRNDNSIAFIVSSNAEDISTGLSAFIADSFNIPYFIISNKDNSFTSPGSDMNLKEINDWWKNRSIYNLVSPFIDEIETARLEGDKNNIKIDKTKEEILSYFEEALKNYDSIYFFINLHADFNLWVYSSGKTEQISSFNLSNCFKTIDKPIKFIQIGNHCYDKFEKNLVINLNSYKNIEYSLLTASDVIVNSPDLLEAINYSNDGIVTLQELEKLSNGEGGLGTVKENGRVISKFFTNIPNYLMNLDTSGLYDLNIGLFTNTTNKSLFYIRLNYFEDNN